jgi:hypothetical protein
MVLSITTTLEISTSAAVAWKLFGEDFADHSSWATSITSSVLDRAEMGVGATRTIDDATLGPGATQTVTTFDREAMELGYEFVRGIPAPCASINNVWKIEAIDATHCRATSEATFVLKCWAYCLAPVLRKKMGASLQGSMESFRAAAEAPGGDKKLT